MSDLSLVEDRDVGSAGSHFDESYSELLLVLSKDTQGARQRLEHELAHVIASSLD